MIVRLLTVQIAAQTIRQTPGRLLQEISMHRKRTQGSSIMDYCFTYGSIYVGRSNVERHHELHGRELCLDNGAGEQARHHRQGPCIRKGKMGGEREELHYVIIEGSTTEVNATVNYLPTTVLECIR